MNDKIKNFPVLFILFLFLLYPIKESFADGIPFPKGEMSSDHGGFPLQICPTVHWEDIPPREEASIPDLDKWLESHSDVAETLIWESSSPQQILAWKNWPNSMKEELRKNFKTYWKWMKYSDPIYQEYLQTGIKPKNFDCVFNPFFDPDPDPVTNPPVDLQWPYRQVENTYSLTVMSPEDAQRLFVKTVALRLVLEVGDYVPWSVMDYNLYGRTLLFDGREMFKRLDKGKSKASSYHEVYQTGYSPGVSIPPPPLQAFSFFAHEKIIGSTRQETVSRMLEWSRRLRHTYNQAGTVFPDDVTNAQVVYKYKGFSDPATRILSGTTMMLPIEGPPYPGHHHWVNGCVTTTHFLKSMLPVLNLPTMALFASHAMPGFMIGHDPSTWLYLSHADDVHALALDIPSDELLISNGTYLDWFLIHDPDFSVGRRVQELSIEYLPAEIMWTYCKSDVPNGLTGENSEVYKHHFKSADGKTYYTPEKLEEIKFWERLNEKIDSLGGCDQIPYPPQPPADW